MSRPERDASAGHSQAVARWTVAATPTIERAAEITGALADSALRAHAIDGRSD